MSITNKCLVFSNLAGTKLWVIFVKSRSWADNYSIDINGSGCIITFENAHGANDFVTACTRNNDADMINVCNDIITLEFYGKNKQMQLKSILQNNTVVSNDDIAQMTEMTKTQFDNFCNALASKDLWAVTI